MPLEATAGSNLVPTRVRVVLLQTSHPGNIGAVARAMKNMGLERLYLVQPKRFPHAEATARASGAADVLAKAVVIDSLEAALVGCGLVVGASARLRAIPWPTIDPRECADKVIKSVAQTEVALVLGREDAGLTNAEMELCNYLVHIPANPAYSSLNIAAALQVLVYEIRMAGLLAGGDEVGEGVESDFPPATADEMAGLYTHLESTLMDIGFLDPNNPRQLMRRLRRLFNRAHLDKMELNILRGILSKTQALQDTDKTGEKVKIDD